MVARLERFTAFYDVCMYSSTTHKSDVVGCFSSTCPHRSRVLYGGPSSSSKSLPPELEGDERLRNIDPKMVELITNEVRGCSISLCMYSCVIAIHT